MPHNISTPTDDAKYRELFERVPIGLYRSTPDGRIVDANPTLVRMLGYPDAQALLGEAAGRLYAKPEDRGRWLAEMAAKGTVSGFETAWRRRDGTVLQVVENAHAVCNGTGRVLHYEGSAEDVTARRGTEARLAEEKARFEQLFAASPEAIVLCANDATVLRVNAEFTTMFGYTEKEAIGRNIDELVAKGLNGLHEHACGVTHSIAGGETTFVETRRRRKNGEIFDVSILGRSIVIGGEQVALYAIYRDITERVAMEIKLTEEKARFEQLFAASPEAIVLCANDGTILRMNEEFTRLFGYTRDEALGRNVDELVSRESAGLKDEARGITQQIADGQTSFVETRRRHRDGRSIDVSILGKPILIDGDQIAVYGIYRDISARKEAESSLAATRKKVERLHEAADALGKAEKEDEVYRVTVEAAERVLGFSLGALYIAEGDGFACRAASSQVEAGKLDRKTISPTGIVAESLESGRPIIATDPEPEKLPEGVPTTTRSVVCALIGEIGIFQAVSPEPDAFREEDGRLLSILLEHTAVAVSRLRLQAQLVEQARHDALTGVFNRHYFNERIAQEVLRASRYNHPIGLLMIDVDRFKEINDSYGHQTGDMVLREIAAVLRETVRASDMIVRYGGDEFLVVLIETGEDSEQAATRIRHAVRGNQRLLRISGFDVTVSVGSIFWHPDANCPIEEALAQADARMYEDKRRR